MIPWREMVKTLRCSGAAPFCVVVMYVTRGELATSGKIAHTSEQYKFRGTVCPLIPKENYILLLQKSHNRVLGQCSDSQLMTTTFTDENEDADDNDDN